MNYQNFIQTDKMTKEELLKDIAKTENEILSFKAQIKDWSSRVYKTSNKKVSDVHTEGDKYYNLDVNYINENRRRKNIKFFNEEIFSLNEKISYTKIYLEKENERLENLKSRNFYKCLPTLFQVASECGIIFECNLVEEYNKKDSCDFILEDLFDFGDNAYNRDMNQLRNWVKDNQEKTNLIYDLLGDK